MDPNSNSAHFLPPGVNPFVVPTRFSANQPDYHHITGPQSNVYQPPPIHGGADVHSSPSSSNHSFTLPVEYPPITPPHLTHSRRGSRESGETSSSNSTPSSGPAGGSLVHRHKRGHASASMSPVSPVALRKSRKAKKKDSVEDEDEDEAMLSDEDPVVSQKLRREDAKKSRQDAEQKRRDQLKGAYDMLRGAVPGTSEKTSKVLLVNHARLYIDKLIGEREKLRANLADTQQELKSLRNLNQRLMSKLMDHKIDFEEDLRATEMEIPPDDEETPERGALVHQQSSTPTNAGPPSLSTPGPQGPFVGPPMQQHHPGHLRTSSNVSGSHFQLQVPPTTGLPMSAPSHSTSLPNYPPLPISTPSSPLKGSNPMLQPLTIIPAQGVGLNGGPPLHLTFPGAMHAIPSPSSSASSSAPRHSLYSPDGQHPMFYSDDPSSSDSHRGSAASSHVAVNVAHLSLEEQAFIRQQQQQHGSTPHSPSQVMGRFGGQPYPDPNSFRQPEMHFTIQGYGDPGLSLQNDNGQRGGDGMNGRVPPPSHGYAMSHDDMNSMPAIPGAFPHDESIGYPPPHQPHSGVAFLSPAEIMYQEQPESQVVHMDYGHPTLTFTHGRLANGHERQMGSDVYLPTSPNASRGSSPPPSLHHQQQQQHQHAQFVSSPSSQHTPQAGMGSQHLSVSTPSMGQMGSSPRHVDQSLQLHSPMPAHSPSGSYQDTPNGNGRPETGIAPSMLIGGPEPGSHDQSHAAPAGGEVGDTNGSSDGPWYQGDPPFAQ